MGSRSSPAAARWRSSGATLRAFAWSTSMSTANDPTAPHRRAARQTTPQAPCEDEKRRTCIAMTARMWYDVDADPGALAGQRIAVLGYGSQGHAHALNLRDSGCDVRVGLPESSRSRDAARAEGLRVLTPAEACAEADIIMVLIPDTAQRELYDAAVVPNLKPGKMLMFAHGFNIRFGLIEPPQHVDVSMVAPKGPGHLVRSTYAAGQAV